ncbi:hypothetical protein AAFF_G00407370 [Aldrovandia affinis]|uniref:Reverse transcriptase domain-containing protein n=1 Tax=Aldrovandia affinis TaxID=143900 RepID=A0AAD7R3Z6_9TELE|nr:hypothetical protein AAFF_G00407370 [Aldrovandia affinis]
MMGSIRVKSNTLAPGKQRVFESPGREMPRTIELPMTRVVVVGWEEEEERDVDEPQGANPVAPTRDPRTESSQRTRSLKKPLRRNKIKWPKANESEEWRKLDEHLSGLLQTALRGSVETKLNLFGEILYEECSNRYGEVTVREAVARTRGGEREIDDLVASRRQLRKRWRKADESEKEGLKVLWDEIRSSLANLRRAERIRRWRKRKKERSSFFRNPFRHARGLLEEKTSGTLDVSKEDLEEHIRAQYSDPARNNPLGSPGYVPRPTEPSALFDTSPPKLSEVRQVIQRARSASAPGPNGIPYKLYKNCPRVLKLLWTLMRVTWNKQSMLYTPREAQNPGFLAAGVNIQTTKREKKDLHVIWLDLANAYGSVPHQLIAYALEFFYIPDNIRTMIMNYFQDIHMCFALKKFTTGWQQLK